MSLEQLNALESRIRRLVDFVQQAQRENATLRRELRAAQEQLREQEQQLRDKDNEQTGMCDRIERILGELDGIEHGMKR